MFGQKTLCWVFRVNASFSNGPTKHCLNLKRRMSTSAQFCLVLVQSLAVPLVLECEGIYNKLNVVWFFYRLRRRVKALWNLRWWPNDSSENKERRVPREKRRPGNWFGCRLTSVQGLVFVEARRRGRYNMIIILAVSPEPRPSCICPIWCAWIICPIVTALLNSGIPLLNRWNYDIDSLINSRWFNILVVCWAELIIIHLGIAEHVNL